LRTIKKGMGESVNSRAYRLWNGFLLQKWERDCKRRGSEVHISVKRKWGESASLKKRRWIRMRGKNISMRRKKGGMYLRPRLLAGLSMWGRRNCNTERKKRAISQKEKEEGQRKAWGKKKNRSSGLAE